MIDAGQYDREGWLCRLVLALALLVHARTNAVPEAELQADDVTGLADELRVAGQLADLA
jgi:hypothetical protein